MKTYARYKYTTDYTAKRVGAGWHIVEKEYVQWYPSGRHNTLVINGCAVKACHCEIVQVIIQISNLDFKFRFQNSKKKLDK